MFLIVQRLALGALALGISGVATAVEVGEPVDPMQGLGVTLEGGELTVGDLAGRPAIICFWRTTCHLCAKEMPLLEGLRRKLGDRIHVVAVSMDSRMSAVRRFQNKNDGLQMRVTFDKKLRAARALGAPATPTTLVLGPDGTLVHRRVGYSEETFRSTVAEVAALLSD